MSIESRAESVAEPLSERAADALPPLDTAPTALVALAREAGYRSTPAPLAETLLVARPLLAAAGLAVPDGQLTVAAGPLDVRFTHVDTDSRVGPSGAAGTDDALRVSGTLHRVPWARAVEAAVVLTEGPGGGPVLFLLEATEWRQVAGTNLAGEPRDDLVLLDVAVPAERVRRVPAALVREAAWRSGLARAALIAGAARRCVELTVDHTSSRVQFGRPLSHFQAVKQEEAKLVEEAALVAAAVEAAASALSEPDSAEFTAWLAAAQAAASVAEITRIAHQLHGAIGFTELSPLRLATTRMWSWRDEDGGERAWQQRIGRHVLDGDGGGLWQQVTGG
ncbi:acyl-CoA dehydrogenase family protein [Streptomyces sp. 769]|uniref:acyl-CoA dehydrogenase family protein n=1 Tax=Streptomyces sp. 769 TaxID=1262452 RepID=UPI000581F0EA|nr:acyl-CoA dehydrogenase family protein [Streptomyces sp. 769]AJC54765.1 acyl-CoA dehydrogenase domain-containing protein [Streptomyces sp. 769]